MVQNKKPSEKVGKNLKHLIKQSEFKTQNKFADAMYVDHATARRWISHGIKDINLIYAIAEMFDVDVMTILK